MPIPERMLTAMKQAQRVVLIAHVSPDGDTLGSALALRLALLAIGAVADVVCQDAVPELYATLPGAGTVVPPEKVAGRVYDLAVAVDVSDALRMGDCSPVFEAARSRMVVDHHGTNTRFGEENWVDPDASATGVLVLQLVRALGAELTPEIARCLFVALSTDTGHFQYQNTNAQALRAAADCVEAHIDVAQITEGLYRERPRAKTELLACALRSLTFERGGRLAYMKLSRADFERCGASDAMSEGLINYAIETQGVKVAFLARENDAGVKFSLRSRPPYDVAAVCQRFGGGGHVFAAGCTIAAPLDEAVSSMLAAIDVG